MKPQITPEAYLTFELSIKQASVRACMLSCFGHVQLFVTLWTVGHQAPLSMRFPRQENWSGLPFPSPGDLPNPGIKPGSPALQADSLPSEPLGKPNVFEMFLKHEIRF